ncbi:MAG: aminoacetone oxidase family FAD-binding enzyme [Clostridia bacterium]|nr:aminoacetone oxidase family FAD-binding enzyme [Clostridia bacterium]
MKVVVIGGGVSGLTYSICSVKYGNQVILLEANARVGKKLLLTGGGRCNITNARVNCDAYNNPSFIKNFLTAKHQNAYQNFLKDCGIFLSNADDEGRIYPITYSSASVCDCLRLTAQRLGVDIRCNCFVTEIKKANDGFMVATSDQKIFADKVVVAVGSGSQATNPNLQNLIDKKYLTKLVPSLCPLKVDNTPKGLSGVRTRATINLIYGNKTIATQTGELQFRDFGLSGICILNLSSYVARRRVANDLTQFDLVVDFLPEFTQKQVYDLIVARQKQGYKKEELLVGLLPNKIAEWLQKTCQNDIKKISQQVKNTIFFNAQTVDFSLSQVTSGGVDVNYLDDFLTLPNGITVLGEALDVDGLCGGYNLHFSILSAIVASKSVDSYQN